MLKQRIITAVILAPIAIVCVFFLPPLEFAFFIGLVLTIAAWEWASLAGFEGSIRYIYAAVIAVILSAASFVPALPVLIMGAFWWTAALALVVLYPGATSAWSAQWVRAILGVFMLVPGFAGLLVLKNTTDSTFLILLLFLLIWGADVGAYFAGRAFGKRKLAPEVSPGKSWAGLYGGLATAMLIAIGMTLWAGKPSLDTTRGAIFLVACAFVVLTSVLGDLAVSMFKRHRGVKDSSNLLPGHGGFLDRIDSLLAAGPAFSLFILLFGWA